MSEEESPRVAIGISFGNSYSSIAHTTPEGKAEVIANEEGDRQIPSILSYVEGEEFQGTQAKAQLVRNSKNTVAYFRDFIGQNFKSIDPTPCHQSAHPIEHENTIAFKIKDTEAEEENIVSISEITTRHIKKLVASASDFLGKPVTAAVVTVPTNFSDVQKHALKQAAEAAGVEILQFIAEPVAAVLAYDARSTAEIKDKVIVVADLGGTRSDVAVIASRGGMYSILATAHDYDFSGSHLDTVLVDHFAKEFLKKHKSASDPRLNARSLAKLKLESEAVKKALSLGASANFSVESLSDGLDFTATVNRSRYDLLASKVFAGFTRLVLGAVGKADLDPLDIAEIVLAGGTSHTPKIATALQNAFPESTSVLAPATSVTALNPSELAARGAAIQASLVAEFETEDVEQSTHPVVTVTPHLATAIGVLCLSSNESQARFSLLVDRATPVPVRRTKVFPTPREGGDVLVRLVEAVAEIKITAPAPRTKNRDEQDVDGEEESESEESEEEEEHRELVWRPTKTIAEAAVRGVKKGGRVEVQVNVGAGLECSLLVREVGGKGGVRGEVRGR
ncbi:putative ribosome-associated complex subunit SSZ1 [Patellaria atrata CBS 101060]|uniref:Ribosome-associated complex subunit SSZ1 n=1 Tax=Patellaria atrata CBS 101060 TaxID=1346257 RepID=A0A9P4SC12_9PEZI|nr:putative ribosome-associated complex subunit SSZ1 [Patellaria atrata CBS 101060]